MTSLVIENSDNVTAAEALDSLSTVMASSRLLLTLINNLLDVRKMDAMMMDEFKLSSTLLAPAMHESMQFCRPIAFINDAELEMTLDFNEDDVKIMTNPVRFQQVVVNLVSNAIKYTNKSIELRAEVLTKETVEARLNDAFAVGLDKKLCDSVPDLAVISISDKGSGLPEAMRGRVFGKFAQYNGLSEKEVVRGCNTAQ